MFCLEIKTELGYSFATSLCYLTLPFHKNPPFMSAPSFPLPSQKRELRCKTCLQKSRLLFAAIVALGNWALNIEVPVEGWPLLCKNVVETLHSAPHPITAGQNINI